MKTTLKVAKKSEPKSVSARKPKTITYTTIDVPLKKAPKMRKTITRADTLRGPIEDLRVTIPNDKKIVNKKIEKPSKIFQVYNRLAKKNADYYILGFVIIVYLFIFSFFLGLK